MFRGLVALGIQYGKIHVVDVTDGSTTVLLDKGEAGFSPDGVVVRDGTVYWTTMGRPIRDRSVAGEAGLDYSPRNGGLHAVGLDGSGRRDLVPEGCITSGKQLDLDDSGQLYWSDREGCKVSRANVDGSQLTDLVVNPPDSPRPECVGVAVAPAAGYLYWTQKGPPNGGVGAILRAGLTVPDGEDAAHRSDIEVLWTGLPEPVDLKLHDGFVYWTDRADALPGGNSLNRAAIPAKNARGDTPQLLADGFRAAIGVTIDGDAGLAYVADLGGRIRAVSIGDPTGTPPPQSWVLADLGERLSGIDGITDR